MYVEYYSPDTGRRGQSPFQYHYPGSVLESPHPTRSTSNFLFRLAIASSQSAELGGSAVTAVSAWAIKPCRRPLWPALTLIFLARISSEVIVQVRCAIIRNDHMSMQSGVLRVFLSSAMIRIKGPCKVINSLLVNPVVFKSHAAY